MTDLSNLLLALLGVVAIATAVVAALARHAGAAQARQAASYPAFGRARRLGYPKFMVFGLLSFWAYTAIELCSQLQEHFTARGTTEDSLGRIAKSGRIVAFFYVLTALIVAGWFLGMMVFGSLDIDTRGIMIVALSSITFYVSTLFFVAMTIRAMRRHEAIELARMGGESQDDFDKRWEKREGAMYLFLVTAFPIAASPTLGMKLVPSASLEYLAYAPLVCFFLAAVFHLWGTRLLVGAFNDHVAHEARMAAATGNRDAQVATGAATRQLMAIMLTDMSGFSRRMEANEERAFAQVQEHNALVRESIARFGGQEIKTTGDGFLVLFKSAVDAVAAANAIQASLADRSKGRSADDALSIRIGLHIGDVRLAEGDVFGDAVNVTARIEPLAPVGGICMSEDIYSLVRKKMDLTAAERVEGVQVKNIAAPLTVYRLPRAASETA